MSGKLNAKQKRFAEEYLVDLNATEAAKRAGYSEKTAYAQGHRLLKHAEVAALISRARERLQERTEVTQERVIAELAKIGFANMSDYMKATENGDPYLDFHNLTRDQAAALSEVTVDDYVEGRGDEARDVRRVKFKLHDKQTALRLIGKHLGMFGDKVELTGANGGPIQVDDARESLARRIAGIAARIGESAGTPGPEPQGG